MLCAIMLAFAMLFGIILVPADNSLISVNVSAAENKLPAPMNIKASVTKTTITLSWDKVGGADAYMVYIFNTETDEYENYKTVKETTCTAKGLAENTTYKFKVAALVENKGKYSVQTKSDKIVVKTSGAKKKANSLTKRTTPGEFVIPMGGDSIEDVLKNSGIANWVDSGASKVAAYSYSGTVLVSGIKSIVVYHFNSKKQLLGYAVYIPASYIDFSGVVSAFKDELGKGYEVEYEDNEIMYYWKTEKIWFKLGYEYDDDDIYMGEIFWSYAEY